MAELRLVTDSFFAAPEMLRWLGGVDLPRLGLADFLASDVFSCCMVATKIYSKFIGIEKISTGKVLTDRGRLVERMTTLKSRVVEVLQLGLLRDPMKRLRIQEMKF